MGVRFRSRGDLALVVIMNAIDTAKIFLKNQFLDKLTRVTSPSPDDDEINILSGFKSNLGKGSGCML